MDYYRLIDAFRDIVKNKNLAEKEAENVMRLLPAEIKFARVILDPFSKIWLYEYGEDYRLGEKGEISAFGTDQFLPVPVLFNGIYKLQGLISNSELLEFTKRLGNKTKHLDLLSELDPVIRLGNQIKTVSYETKAFSPGSRNIDWYFEFQDNTTCLVEVKNRIKGLINQLEEIAKGCKPSAPFPDGIFTSSVGKFKPAITNRYQGLWILSRLLYDEKSLNTEFNSIDPLLIQFAVITYFGEDAKILSRDEKIKLWVKERFFGT